MINIAVQTVVHAKGSLRCAAKVAGYYCNLMGWHYGRPSHNTVCNWVKRLGLYALDHQGSKVGRYIGIIDESIQIGREKCLLFLCIKIPANYSRFRPLTMADVEVLGVEVQNSWKAEQVEDFVKRRLAYHDQIDFQYMISDQGTNLVKALEQLNIDGVADCSHVLMNTVKKMLTGNVVLGTITKFMGTYRRQNTLSERTALCPPTLRDKDRFLRIFVILDWVKRIDSYWPKLTPAHRTSLKYLNNKRLRAFIAMLAQLREIICLATGILKTSGINLQSQQAWFDRLTIYRKENTLSKMAEKLIETVNEYFERHLNLVKKYDRLICCSDIIESTFGRYKNKGGMKVISADVLAIPLYALKMDVEFVVKGLTTIFTEPDKSMA